MLRRKYIYIYIYIYIYMLTALFSILNKFVIFSRLGSPTRAPLHS